MSDILILLQMKAAGFIAEARGAFTSLFFLIKPN